MPGMGAALKWIGGTSAVAAVLLGAAIVGGNALQAEGTPPARQAQQAPMEQPPSPATGKAAPEPVERPFIIRHILPIDGPIKYGEWHWDESAAPAEGPLVITVDLEARVLSVFRDGYEIGATAVLLGTDEHPTPLGIFPILSKERHNVSEKYGNAPMPWTMRLTPDGVAIHGGHAVERGWASHGCIGAPDPFVSRLFAVARPGDKVIITRGRKAALGTSLAV
jgi:lipoprotein-anchoring transpeptidase ErfK/SrfK